MKKPALFIDRDGTISEEVGYLNHPSRLQIYPESPAAIRLLNTNDWLAIVITNQSGVARGYFTEELLIKVNQRLVDELKRTGAELDAIYYCAHHPTAGRFPYQQECDCRKPKPGLIKKACQDFEIDLLSSWIVGDRYSDVLLAKYAGIRSALVLSGYGRGEWEYQRDSWTTQPDLVCENLLEAVTSILSNSQQCASMLATADKDIA